jgi:hypothetical protein
MFLEAPQHLVIMKMLLLHLQELVIKEILVHKVLKEFRVHKVYKVLKVFRVKQEHLSILLVLLLLLQETSNLN